MTIYDYHMVMIHVNIAVLKARLSFYLAQVRQGAELLVLDRSTPVAKVVSSGGEEQGAAITKARKSPRGLRAMKVRPVKHATDAGALLREERDRR